MMRISKYAISYLAMLAFSVAIPDRLLRCKLSSLPIVRLHWIQHLNWSVLKPNFCFVSAISLHSANSYSLAKRAGSNTSLNRKHLASFGGGASGGGSGSDQASESHYSVRSSRSGAGSSGERAKSRSESERGSETEHPQVNTK